MSVWFGPRGIQIEVIVLDDRQRLRITQTIKGRRYLVAYASTVREVERHAPLADLVEVIELPVR